MPRTVQREEYDHNGQLMRSESTEIEPEEAAAAERAGVLDAYLLLPRPTEAQTAEALRNLISLVTGNAGPSSIPETP